MCSRSYCFIINYWMRYLTSVSLSLSLSSELNQCVMVYEHKTKIDSKRKWQREPAKVSKMIRLFSFNRLEFFSSFAFTFSHASQIYLCSIFSLAFALIHTDTAPTVGERKSFFHVSLCSKIYSINFSAQTYRRRKRVKTHILFAIFYTRFQFKFIVLWGVRCVPAARLYAPLNCVCNAFTEIYLCAMCAYA